MFIKVVLPVLAVMWCGYCITGYSGLYISNLSPACYRCLCHVSTGCDISHGCTGGYCGPFNISRVYWIDAGKVTLPEDDPERNHELYISNLSPACYRCLCHVSTGCDISHGCTGGYCGCFNISRVYWIDAGKVTLPEDDPERNHAWEDCARSYHCATRILEGYLQKFGKDCNSDGVTNCFDYMMINGNGGYGCTSPLSRSANGRRWLKRFEECGLTL